MRNHSIAARIGFFVGGLVSVVIAALACKALFDRSLESLFGAWGISGSQGLSDLLAYAMAAALAAGVAAVLEFRDDTSVIPSLNGLPKQARDKAARWAVAFVVLQVLAGAGIVFVAGWMERQHAIGGAAIGLNGLPTELNHIANEPMTALTVPLWVGVFGFGIILLRWAFQRRAAAQPAE